MHDVLLINMPFANLLAPSIGLGILKAALTRAGISAKVLNFHLRFAELCGKEAYNTIYHRTCPEHLVGEWIFSDSLFSERNDSFQDYVSGVLSASEADRPDTPIYGKSLLVDLVERIPLVRERVHGFLEGCLEDVRVYKPRIIGFTSMFEQHLASLSLAKLIKSRIPDTFIIFGGSNCEGPMGAETLRQFGFVDVVVSGEGEVVFPEIVRSILASGSIGNIQGIFSRERPFLPVAGQSPQNTVMTRDLDTVPIPDYDDYFEQLRESSIELPREPTLLLETSRGCWWGEKQHCTFCGLNGTTMTYRSKSAQRALDELIYLADRHPGCKVTVVDNILDMKYFKTFLKVLAERKRDFGLFYEVKSNLRKDQLKLLAEAGVKTIQPGIESFSDNVLRLMRKGVSTLQNIQLLKWCAELNMRVFYNVLWGFPGESAADYDEVTRLIPLISHLRHPVGSGMIRIDRFSPNFNENVRFGFGELLPFPAYYYVYPFKPEAVFNLAYFFEPKCHKPTVDRSHVTELSKAIKSWEESYKHSNLFFIEKETTLLIRDTRPIANEPLVILDGDFKAAYLACDEARTPKQILQSAGKNFQQVASEADLKKVLASLVDRSLMICQGEQYLALAYRKVV